MAHQKIGRPPNKFVKIGAPGCNPTVTVPVRLIEPCCNCEDDISSAAADKPRPNLTY